MEAKEKTGAVAAKKEKRVKEKAEKAIVHSSQEGERTFAVRGNILEGKVISAKANKTVTVERILTQYIPKYERYLKIKSKVHAHNPLSINAKEGDTVMIGETRRISKTKNFVVMKVLNKKE